MSSFPEHPSGLGPSGVSARETEPARGIQRLPSEKELACLFQYFHLSENTWHLPDVQRKL